MKKGNLVLILWLLFFIIPGAKAENCCSRGWFEEIIVQGKVIQIRPPLAILKTSRGEIFYVRLGPHQFWKTRGYYLEKGQKVLIQGYRCGDMIFPKVIRSKKGQIRLRDERGIPLWRRDRLKFRF